MNEKLDSVLEFLEKLKEAVCYNDIPMDDFNKIMDNMSLIIEKLSNEV